jgi:DNA-binding transcriptional ArsR family regulator
MSKRWTIIFKALGNINRIKIIQMLHKGQSLNVTQISEELGISLKATSQHLIILQNLDVLEAQGKQGHVYYTLSGSLPTDIKNAIKLFN